MRKTLATLALQGGGSHGAFTWGVLDQLLEDGRVDIAAVSGASAGAMNAVALAYGGLLGGREGARQALKDFWDAVAASAPPNFIPIDWSQTDGLQVKPTPAFSAYLSMVRFFAPYQLNPFDLNPLRDILAAQIDFDRLRTECRLDLFIATTRVNTGTLRIFRTRELSLEVLLASACLPAVHKTVMIDGEGYWDGGLTANPPLYPLLHECDARDVIAVLLHPLSLAPRTDNRQRDFAAPHRDQLRRRVLQRTAGNRAGAAGSAAVAARLGSPGTTAAQAQPARDRRARADGNT